MHKFLHLIYKDCCLGEILLLIKHVGSVLQLLCFTFLI